MSQIEIGFIMLGLLIIFIGTPIYIICCCKRAEFESLKPLGKYLLK